MANVLQRIVDKALFSITLRQGYVEVLLDDGYLLIISNRTAIHLDPADVGNQPKVAAVTRAHDRTEIAIGTNSRIVIGFRADDFRMPEAFTLTGPDGTWVDRGDDRPPP
jgi:hypothetical protein